MLRIDDVSLSFGGLQVLKSVSLQVPEGQIVGLIGPNGSGKSSLLNVATGIYQPQAGRVTIGKRKVMRFEPDVIASLGVGRTFQIPRLARRLSVFQNMLAGGRGNSGENVINLFFRPSAVKRDERMIEEKAWEIIKRLGLEKKANEYAGRLSGGQQKLLSMGILLMSDPAILLIDEPAAGVNPVLIEQQMDFLIQLRREGRAILLIEHNMDMISSLCDHVYVLDGGQVLAHGSPQDIRRNEAVMNSYLGAAPDDKDKSREAST